MNDPDTSMERLLRENQVQNWDLLLIGDGSGSGATEPCGWAVTLIDRITGVRRLLTGALNLGSITIGELLPYIIALDHFDTVMKLPQHRKGLSMPLSLSVHVFTDSQHTARAGAQIHSRARHGGLWAAIAHYEKNGYNITWHWFEEGRENPFKLHALMDEMASEARMRMCDIEQTSELYDLLP